MDIKEVQQVLYKVDTNAADVTKSVYKTVTDLETTLGTFPQSTGLTAKDAPTVAELLTQIQAMLVESQAHTGAIPVLNDKLDQLLAKTCPACPVTTDPALFNMTVAIMVMVILSMLLLIGLALWWFWRARQARRGACMTPI